MARIKIGNFEVEDTQALNETLEQHAKFLRKEISEEKEKEWKEREAKLEQSWTEKQQNETFTNSIKDETNRKLVSTLIGKGLTRDEIKKEFPNLVGGAEPKPNGNPTETKTIDLNSILQSQSKEFNATLQSKKVSEMTENEKQLWIIQNAEKRNHQ